jgi:hypothetical protein
MELNVTYRGFTLDSFQTRAITELENGHSLVLAAPTGERVEFGPDEDGPCASGNGLDWEQAPDCPSISGARKSLIPRVSFLVPVSFDEAFLE